MLFVVVVIIELMVMFMQICVIFRQIDCISMLLCVGLMNCGSNDRYSIVIFGLSRLVSKFIVQSLCGLFIGSLCIWKGVWLFGCIVCYVRYSRQIVLLKCSVLQVNGMVISNVVMLKVVYSMQKMKFVVIFVSDMSFVLCFWQIECEIRQIMFGLGVSIMLRVIRVKVSRLVRVGMVGLMLVVRMKSLQVSICC